MIWTLRRIESNKNGVFGELLDNDYKHFCYTLEHPYPTLQGVGFEAKVPAVGTFKCVRGTHRLEHGGPFETFEVTGVAGHTGILFHVGNSKDDSEGCILLGNLQNNTQVLQSKDAFSRFMTAMNVVNEFDLNVK